MKINRLILGFAVALTTVSCVTSGKTADPMKGIPKIPEIIGASLVKEIISPDHKDTLESKLTYEFYATPEFPWQDSVNCAIGKFVWGSMSFNEKPYKYEPLAHAYFQERLDTFERNCHLYEDGAKFAMMWECEIGSEIDDSLRDFAQVKQSCYIFTGDAHPNSFSSFAVVSKKDGKTLQLKDLVRDVTQFNRMAEKYFRIAREIAPEASLADDFLFENNVFACNNNFFITSEGITFFFNPYEVAAYVYGPTLFTVPLAEIKSLLSVDLGVK